MKPYEDIFVCDPTVLMQPSQNAYLSTVLSLQRVWAKGMRKQDRELTINSSLFHCTMLKYEASTPEKTNS